MQGSPSAGPGPWGRDEHHITGDVAVAAWQYWAASGDDAWLRSDLEPLLRGAADFWASSANKSAIDGKYHINHVMARFRRSLVDRTSVES